MHLVIPVLYYQKILAYVRNIPIEISGLGKLSVLKDCLIVEDVRLFKQSANELHTVLDRRELAKFYDELLASGEDSSQWKLWWHSHGTGKVFWSPTDEATINDFDTQSPSDNWMVSLETNHAGQVLTRLDFFAPLRCTVEDLGIEILFDDDTLSKATKMEIMQKVTYHPPLYRKRKNQVSWTVR